MFVAVALVALLTATLLAINIGQLYYAQRDLQKQAVLAALAGAKVGSGCGNDGVPGSLAEVTAAVNQSLNANKNTLTPAALTGINGAQSVEVGWVNDSKGQKIIDDAGNPHGGPGTLDDDGKRHFFPLADGDSHINAVRVNVSTSSYQFPFFAAFTPQTLYASATAEQAPRGAYYLGTQVAGLNGGVLNLLLGTLLCRPGDTACVNNIINLNVAGSTAGLASVNVSLGQLATAVGVNVQDLSDPLVLSTKTPLLSDVLNGLVGALSGVVSGTVSGLLQSLANASTNPNGVPLGHLLGAVDAIVADVPFVDLLDLILALGQAAQAAPGGGVQPIALPVNVDVPGVATARVFVNIGKPPQFSGLVRAGQSCGDPDTDQCARTAEISVLLRVQAGQVLTGLLSLINNILNGLLDVLGVLGLNVSITVAPGPINIGADVNAAQAVARLDTLACPTTSKTTPTAGLSASPAIADVKVGTFTGSLPPVGTSGNVPALDTSTNAWPLAEVNLDASHVCVGLDLFHHCIGLPINLGKTDLTLGLELTDLTVGAKSGSFESLPKDVKDFDPVTLDASGSAPQYPTYLAYGAPTSVHTSSDNPQTVGAPVAVHLQLGLTTEQTGGGLLGALVGLVSNLVNGLISALEPLLDLVNVTLLNLVNALLNILGLQLGAATVTMDTAVIPPPTLVTTELPQTQGP
ncbi:MAG: hypothetical protein IRZ06_07110 [Nevskia sp.]|nr:hypothetical protein [Nevskia sp.]